MKVETFEVEEVAQCNAEELDQAQALSESLGLDEQVSAYKAMRTIGKPMPFRTMTHEESVVYGTVLPERTMLEAFRHPIPPRVLEVVALARECRHPKVEGGSEPFFKYLQVWHPKDVRRDPVLVGWHAEDPKWAFLVTPYILARWGEALDEWPALVEKFRAIVRGKVAETRAIVEAACKRAESGSLDAFAPGNEYGGWAPIFQSSLNPVAS